jgi:hypothetical protein
MRHFLSPRTIAPGTRGMIVSTARGRLVALPGCALFAAPALPGAASLTVDVAAIAARTDQDLDAAAHTEIQTRGCICLFAFVTQTWTKAPTDGILPRHRASARCGARRRYKLPGWDRRRACLQRRQAFNSSSSAESPDAHRSSAAQRIPIPAPQRALRAASKEMASRHKSRLHEERLIAVLPPQSEAARRQTPLWSIANTKQPPCAVARLPGAPAVKPV